MNDAPFLAMSEYDFRSKCVAFECHWHGFARDVIVRDDRESTEKSKIRGAERPLRGTTCNDNHISAFLGRVVAHVQPTTHETAKDCNECAHVPHRGGSDQITCM